MKLILQAIKSMFRGIEASRTCWEETKEVILVDNYTSAEYQEDINVPSCNFVPKQKYNVTWNGVLYENVVCYTDGEYNVLGGDGSGYPFYLDDDGGNAFYVSCEEDEEFTVSVSTIETVVHKLDDKYLSDNIARVKEVRKALNDVQSVANEAQSTANSAITKINSKPSHLECGTTTLPVISSNSIAVGQTLSAEFDKGATNIYNSLRKLGNYGDTISIRIQVTRIVNDTSYAERVIVLHRYDFNSIETTFHGIFTVRFVKNYSSYSDAKTDHFETYYVEINSSSSFGKGFSRLLLTRIS